MLCLRNFPEAENLLIRQGLIKIFRRKYFVSKCQRKSPDKLSLQCFRKLPVSKKFLDKRGGRYQDFMSQTFCITVPIVS